MTTAQEQIAHLVRDLSGSPRKDWAEICKQHLAKRERETLTAVEQVIKARIAHYESTLYVDQLARGLQINEASGCLEKIADLRAKAELGQP